MRDTFIGYSQAQVTMDATAAPAPTSSANRITVAGPLWTRET